MNIAFIYPLLLLKGFQNPNESLCLYLVHTTNQLKMKLYIPLVTDRMIGPNKKMIFIDPTNLLPHFILYDIFCSKSEYTSTLNYSCFILRINVLDLG